MDGYHINQICKNKNAYFSVNFHFNSQFHHMQRQRVSEGNSSGDYFSNYYIGRKKKLKYFSDSK